MKNYAAPKSVSLVTRIGNLELKSPFIAASGTWAYGSEFLDHPIQRLLGAFVTKSLSLYPSEQTSGHRIFDVDAGVINSIGFENIGIDAFLSRIEPQLKLMRSSYVLSLYEQSAEDFKKLSARINSATASAIELNLHFSEPKIIEKIVSSVRSEIKKPLWVKLSPQVNSISELAQAAEAGGADALSMINTVPGMAINIESPKPSADKIMGGLSGPAIRPIALQSIYNCYRKVKIPIIGIGGIHNYRDCIEFFMVGASAVQIGTWNFRDPYIYESLTRELSDFMNRKGFKTVKEMIGLAHD